MEMDDETMAGAPMDNFPDTHDIDVQLARQMRHVHIDTTLDLATAAERVADNSFMGRFARKTVIRFAQNTVILKQRLEEDESAHAAPDVAGGQAYNNWCENVVAEMFPVAVQNEANYVFDPVLGNQYAVIQLGSVGYDEAVQQLVFASDWLCEQPGSIKWPFELAARMYSTLDMTRYADEERIDLLDLMLPVLRRAMLFHENDNRLLVIVLSALDCITIMTEHTNEDFQECDLLGIHIMTSLHAPLPSLYDRNSFAEQLRGLLKKHICIDVLRLARTIMSKAEALQMDSTPFDGLMACILYMQMAVQFSHVQSNDAVTSLTDRGYLGELATRASCVGLMSEDQQQTCMDRMLPLALEFLGILEVGGFSPELKGTLYNSLKRMVWVCTEGQEWLTPKDREQSWIKQMVRENVARARARYGQSPYMTLVCDDLDGSRAV